MAPRSTRPRAARPVALACTAALAASLAGAACGGSDGRPAEAYCGKVAANQQAIESPAMATSADIDAALSLFRDVAASAPAAVEPEWETLVAAMESAATVVPTDPASVARMNDAALSGQPAYTRIQQYTAQTCGTNLGGTPPPPTNPVTATTLPDPDATTASTGA